MRCEGAADGMIMQNEIHNQINGKENNEKYLYETDIRLFRRFLGFVSLFPPSTDPIDSLVAPL